LEEAKGASETVNQRRTENTTAKGQTMIFKYYKEKFDDTKGR
jgi:hypothetical protein